jgi:hypothetical protein
LNQVQTGQCSTVLESLHGVGKDNHGDYRALWRYFPVMLTLDIPFQTMNFILYGIVSDAVVSKGFEPSTWTRLACGVLCGMLCAGVTCPIDVCKTRIIARDKEMMKSNLQFGTNETLNKLKVTSLSSSQVVFLNERNEEKEEAVISCETVCIPHQTTQLEATTVHYKNDNFQYNNNHSIKLDSIKLDTVTRLNSNKNNNNNSIVNSINTNKNVLVEIISIYRDEGFGALFLGLLKCIMLIYCCVVLCCVVFNFWYIV